jgi:hypothetical protein
MKENDSRSRRGFLRTAVVTAVSGTALTVHGQSPEAKPEGSEAVQASRVTLDRNVYEPSGVLNGEIHFVRFLSARLRCSGSTVSAAPWPN